MNTLGNVTIGSQEYFLGISENKTKITYVLYDKYTREDRVRLIKGEPLQSEVLTGPNTIQKYASESYILESVVRMKKTGKVLFYRNHVLTQKLLDAIQMAKMYSFKDSEIIENNETICQGEMISIFSASNDELLIKNEEHNNMIYQLLVKNADVSIDVKPVQFKPVPNSIKYSEVELNVKNKILLSSIKKVTYQTLCDALDMSWFEENGKRKKEYKAITNIQEFEELIMTPLIDAVKYASIRGIRVLLSTDTETTGLHIMDLSDFNPLKDHCVAIPIAWEDNKAFVIFTDMEFFDNVPIEYVLQRLAPLIAEPLWDDITSYTRKELPRSIVKKTVRRKEETDNEELELLGAFGLEELEPEQKDSIYKDYEIEDAETVEFYRSTVDLVGFNTIFDSKVFYGEGLRIWFDEDALQMAFDLNPGVGKGSRKLKALTRRFFGHETPELTDILGKGNEDKYKYLQDLLVATIYGCADADYTRLVRNKLRSIMSDKMYKMYLKQDVEISNILAISEYKGMPLENDKVIEMAKESEENLKMLKEFMYSYVGKYVYIRTQTELLQDKLSAGVINRERFDTELSYVINNIPQDARYEFELKGSAIAYVMYGILQYPILKYTAGDAFGNNKKPSTDSKVLKKLISCTIQEGEERGAWDKGWMLKHDLLAVNTDPAFYNSLIAKGKTKKAEEYCLVNAEKFNKCKYPLAIPLLKFAELNKEYTAYFKPTIENNMEGRLYKNYSLARIETRRIANPGQTMKGKLKAMVKSIGDDYYVCDFDMSQVEYRIMASLSNHTAIIEKMRDPEKDYHIETASLVHNIPAHKVDKKTRKGTKCVGFGLPYGLKIRSLAENLFGEATEDTIYETALMVDTWKKNNVPIIEMLEAVRDSALKERDISDGLRDFIDAWEYDVIKDSKGKIISKTLKLDADGNRIPKPVGMVENKLGFYRIFDLSNMNRRKESSIRRMSGNYPIQSYAAELFREILTRFRRACVKYGIEDKVVWHMLIHDELLCSVHKSVHPFLLYKIIQESCMITKKGHTNYFVGINIGKTWAETKDDSREAPVLFVNRMVKRYEAGEFKEEWLDDPGEFVMGYRRQYIQDRIGEVLKTVQPDLDTGVIDLPLIMEKFTNYTVRSYVDDYPQNREVNKKDFTDENEFENTVWISKFESWLLDVYGEGKKIKGLDGKIYTLSKSSIATTQEKEEPDYAELFEDDIYADTFWSFDEDSVSNGYTSGDELYTPEEEEEDFMESYYKKVKISENSGEAKTVADLITNEKKYEHIFDSRNQYIIKVKNRQQMEKCKAYLKNFVNDKGKSVMFKSPISSTRWLKVSGVDLVELDNFVSQLG